MLVKQLPRPFGFGNDKEKTSIPMGYWFLVRMKGLEPP